MKRISRAALGAAFLMAAGPAFAHATLEHGEAAAGSTYKAVIRVGHGCDGKATKTLRVQIPDGFYNAKPMPKPGWTLTTESGDYARPYDNHGTQMTKGVREIVWSGGELPEEWYDEFTFRGTVGPEVVAGSTIYFPTVQECSGAKAAWIDVTGAEGVANPAPALHVTEAKDKAQAGHMTHGAQAASAGSDGDHAGPVQLGDLAISEAFSRASLPSAPVGGGYMTIVNSGAADDRLIAVSSPISEKAEIHEMAKDGEVMRMRELPDGLAIAAGSSVELKPGGLHIMFMGLKQPTVEGERFPVTLTFEKAGSVDLVVEVRSRDAKGGGHGAH